MKMPFSTFIFGASKLYTDLLCNYISDEIEFSCKPADLDDISPLLSSASKTDQLPQNTLFLMDYHLKTVQIYLSNCDAVQNQALVSDHVFLVLYNFPRDTNLEIHALKNGFRGIFYEDEGADQIKKGLSAVLEGKLWFSRKILKQKNFLKQLEPLSAEQPEAHQLSKREKEILREVVKGKNNKDIATELYISSNTVKKHISNIYKKLGVANRLEATLWTMEHL